MVHYDPLTGVMLTKRGKPITAKQKGYLSLWYDGRIRRVHQVAWYQTYGYWPTIIDHIDGDILNNRIDNLREVTNSQNQMNKGLQKNNKSGTKGVYLQNGGPLWRVQVRTGGIVRTWNSIDCLELAALVADEARAKYQGSFDRQRKLGG